MELMELWGQGRINFATYGALMMGNSGQFERAYAFLDSASELAPRQPFKRIERLRHYDEVQATIETAEALRDKNEAKGSESQAE